MYHQLTQQEIEKIVNRANAMRAAKISRMMSSMFRR